MKEEIKKLKSLNAAYIAALEYDYCPDGKKVKDVMELFDTGISKDELKESLNENQGCRPDEIASSISDLIKSLPNE